MSSLPNRSEPDGYSDQGAQSSPNEDLSRRHKRRIARYKYLLPILIVVGLLAWSLTTNYIPSESMLPDLKPGDHILTMRTWVAYPFGRMPGRGDVVVFALPSNLTNLEEVGPQDEKRRLAAQQQEMLHIPPGSLRHIKGDILIKRVVALPGETVSVKGRDIFINGQKLSGQKFGSSGEPDPFYHYNFAVDEPLKLKADEVFVLGDNISNSEDGRVWGPLKKRNILGRYVRVLWNDGGQKAAKSKQKTSESGAEAAPKSSP